MSKTVSDRNIVIVGAGIIGVCTAYYLALELKKSEHQRPDDQKTRIILVEESESPAAGASGKAAGDYISSSNQD